MLMCNSVALVILRLTYTGDRVSDNRLVCCVNIYRLTMNTVRTPFWFTYEDCFRWPHVLITFTRPVANR